MQIPKISHVPIQQPMYFNGVMHQTWVNFFERLATLSNSADMIQLVELAQKVGEQVSSQASQGQHGFEISTIQNTFDLVQYSSMQHTEKFETIPILPNQTQELPPLQAVFLCHEQPSEKFETIPILPNQTQELPPLQAVFLCQEQPFSMVGLPPSGVISP